MSDEGAIVIVHWPGKDTPACRRHEKQLQGLAAAMGLSGLSCTVIAEEGVKCANCENEAKPK